MPLFAPAAHRLCAEWTLRFGCGDDMPVIRSAADRRRVWLLALPLLLSLGACAGNKTQDSSGADGPAITQVVEPRIEAFLQEMLAEEHFSGVALVTRNGKIIHANGYGIAAEDTPNNVDTAFHVASITKQFTAAAILQLAEAGILNLQDSINRFLPARYNTRAWDEVNVHHLLSHSSGIPDYAITRDYYEVVNGFCLGDTVDGMIQEAMRKELEFAPGTKWSYSNIGFTLLGQIIEEQTNTPYDRYVQEHILGPMGMGSSRIHVEGHVPAKNEATGHRWDEDKHQFVDDDVITLPATAPDGGLITTLGDFLQWIRLYAGVGQNILSPASVAAMTTRQISIEQGGPIDGYGYGIGVGERLIGHGGYIVGFRSIFYFDRQTGTLIAVFANNTHNDPVRIASGLVPIVLALGS
jgi:CubicO group peptidase (beta-lactamase class C family)